MCGRTPGPGGSRLLSLAIIFGLIALTLAPPGLVALGVWARVWPSGRTSDHLLATGVTLPWVCLAEVWALGWLPVHRPLDQLWWLHGAVSAGSLAYLWRTRRAGTGAEAARVLRSAWEAARGRGGGGSGPSIPRSIRALAALGLGLHVLVGGAALWSAQWIGDAADYHLPQALQPWQDGRLGPVQASVVWADSYPRAGALLKFWLMRLSGSDASFNLASYAMSWLLILGVYAGGRRLGLGRAWSLAAAAITPSAPIFSLLCTIGYVDMDFGAVVTAGAALALPGRRGGVASTARAPWPAAQSAACILALSLAWLIKFMACVPIGVILLYRLWLTLGVGSAGARVRAVAGLIVGSGIGLGVAALPYARAWWVYGTPTWPVQLKLGPVVIFDGPWLTDNVAIGDPNLVVRFGRAWSEWFAPLTPDSTGSLGPLFCVACVLPCLGTAAVCWRAGLRRRGWMLPGLLVLAILLLPQLHVPRYAPYLLALGSWSAALVGRGVGRSVLAPGLVTVASGLIVINGWLFVRGAMSAMVTGDGSPMELLGAERNRAVAMESWRGDPRAPTIEARRAAWASVERGGTLVAALRCPTFHLYDLGYTIRVEHRPARAWPFMHDPVADPHHGGKLAGVWVEGLRRDGVLAAMVYAGTAEDDLLASPASGFERVYAQPAVHGPVVHVYRRR